MASLRFIAYGIFALAALALVIGLGEESMFLVLSAVVSAMSGVVFLALDRVIALLAEIRDALRDPAGAAAVAVEAEGQGDGEPTKTLEELQADLDRLSATRS